MTDPPNSKEEVNNLEETYDHRPSSWWFTVKIFESKSFCKSNLVFGSGPFGGSIHILCIIGDFSYPRSKWTSRRKMHHHCDLVLCEVSLGLDILLLPIAFCLLWNKRKRWVFGRRALVLIHVAFLKIYKHKRGYRYTNNILYTQRTWCIIQIKYFKAADSFR